MSTPLQVTDEARSKLAELIDDHPEATAVRVIYQHDKCQGSTLMISLDASREGDHVVESEGLTCVIDGELAGRLGAVTIDFVRREDRSAGFELRAEQLPELIPGPRGCL